MDCQLLTKKDFTLKDLIYKWLDSSRSEETKRSYKASLEEFFQIGIDFIAFDAVKAVSIIDVENYLNELIAKGLKSSTIKAKLSSCSSFYEYLLSFKSNENNLSLLNFNPFKNGIIKQEKAKKICKLLLSF